MQLFTSAEPDTLLNPNDDPDVQAAIQHFVVAGQTHVDAEAERRRVLSELQPGNERRPEPFDFEYINVKGAAVKAHAAMDRAESALNGVRAAATARGQAALDMRVEALWRTFEHDVLPQLRDHAQEMERLQAVADAGGIRFPFMEMLSGPSTLTARGVDEWAALVRRHFGR
jgi:hypothetical protein